MQCLFGLGFKTCDHDLDDHATGSRGVPFERINKKRLTSLKCTVA